MPLTLQRRRDARSSFSFIDRNQDIDNEDHLNVNSQFSQFFRSTRVLYLVISILIAGNALLSVMLARSHYVQPAVRILGPADTPVERVIKTFNTGISSKAIFDNPFVGPSNRQTDAAWNKLLDGLFLFLFLTPTNFILWPSSLF